MLCPGHGLASAQSAVDLPAPDRPHPGPHGLDPPARQAARRHRRRADDRAGLAPRDGSRHRPGGRGLRRAGDRRSGRPGRRPSRADPARSPVRLRPDLARLWRRSIADGRYDVVVNLQGDLPTLDPAAGPRRAGAARRSGRATSPRWWRRSTIRRKRAIRTSSRWRCRWPPAPAIGRALYFSRHADPVGRRPALAPHRPLCLSPRRAGALRDACRRASWSSASGWSSYGRWRTACASTPPSSPRCRSASIRRPIWNGPRPAGGAMSAGLRRPLKAASDPGAHHRLPGSTRRLLRPRLPHRPARARHLALPLVRRCLRRGPRRARRLGDDPDRELGRRPRRRHPPPAAELRPAHHRRALSAGEPSPAGAARRPPRATSRTCTATSMR